MSKTGTTTLPSQASKPRHRIGFSADSSTNRGEIRGYIHSNNHGPFRGYHDHLVKYRRAVAAAEASAADEPRRRHSSRGERRQSACDALHASTQVYPTSRPIDTERSRVPILQHQRRGLPGASRLGNGATRVHHGRLLTVGPPAADASWSAATAPSSNAWQSRRSTRHGPVSGNRQLCGRP